MKMNSKLWASGNGTAFSLLSLALWYSMIYPGLPWSDVSMLGASILIGYLGPILFITIESLHIVILLVVLRWPSVLVFHAIVLLQLLGLSFAHNAKWLTLEQTGKIGMWLALLLFVAGIFVYRRGLRVVARGLATREGR